MDVRGDFLVIGSGIAGLRAAISLADAGDVVVHIFRPEPRAFYALEKMWALENEVAAKPKAAVRARRVKKPA